MIEFIFWLSCFLIIYHYFLYPALVVWMAKVKPLPHKSGYASDDDLPAVSMIIAAYNEEAVIEDKIKNSLEIDYPEDRFQVIVVSDGSDDSTPDIVNRYSGRITGMHEDARKGKSAAINRAVASATGDILVMSDANNDFTPQSVRHLVKHFVDDSVGGVCGLKQIKPAEKRDSTEGDSLYWKYESAIKQAESDLGSITGADGEIFAMRKDLFETLDTTQINDDAELTFSIVRQGKRILYEQEAQSWEYASINIEDDFNVKVRMVAGGYQSIRKYLDYLLSPGWFQFTFLSHKALRWLVPHFMIVAFVTNLMLVDQGFGYQVLMIGQIGFYWMGWAAWKAMNYDEVSGLRYIIFYFCTMNLAAFKGFLRYINGSQSVNWSKAKR